MKKMKKISLMMMALALVVGLTQCKKDNPTENVTPASEGEKYPVTLFLGSGSDAKSDVDPQDTQDIAPVTFGSGDQILVAYNGKHIGTLSYSGTSVEVDQNGTALGKFTGTVTATPDGEKPLYFYYLGNKEVSGLTVGTTGSYTVDLSDQSAALPVISYAASKQSFPSEGNEYTVKYNWLLNQCALVKFTMENIYDQSANANDNNADAIYTTEKPITIYGMENQVTVDLASNEFTWSATNDGAVKLYKPASGGDAVRYAIVHHGSYSMSAGALEVEFNPATDEYGFYGTYKIQGMIPQNDYFQDAKIDLVWHSGAFSISETEQVVFSRGNLQYNQSGNTWRFAKHQYDYVGGEVRVSALNLNTVHQGNVVLKTDVAGDTDLSDNEQIGAGSYVGWIDLYGWGTGNDPTKHTKLNTAYTDWHEWGAHNIVNSGKPDNTTWWQSITHHEWEYLLDDRDNWRYNRGCAMVNGIKGFILLPDNCSVSITPLSDEVLIDGTVWGGNWTDNTYDIAAWKNMELHGAVFFPAAGYRNGTDFDGGTLDNQDHGVYWSSTQSTGAASWGWRFKKGDTTERIYLSHNYAMAPDNGHAVRLVHRLSTSSKLFNKKD